MEEKGKGLFKTTSVLCLIMAIITWASLVLVGIVLAVASANIQQILTIGLENFPDLSIDPTMFALMSSTTVMAIVFIVLAVTLVLGGWTWLNGWKILKNFSKGEIKTTANAKYMRQAAWFLLISWILNVLFGLVSIAFTGALSSWAGVLVRILETVDGGLLVAASLLWIGSQYLADHIQPSTLHKAKIVLGICAAGYALATIAFIGMSITLAIGSNDAGLISILGSNANASLNVAVANVQKVALFQSVQKALTCLLMTISCVIFYKIAQEGMSADFQNAKRLEITGGLQFAMLLVAPLAGLLTWSGFQFSFDLGSILAGLVLICAARVFEREISI